VASRQSARPTRGPAATRRKKRPEAVKGNLPEGRSGDRLIYERVRLGIMSALAVNPTLCFTDLKRLLETTDGNLSVHARKLELAGYISCTKSFDGRVPRTEYKMTAKGRQALEHYLDHMEALIRATRGG
jgi:DNA-binding HxlR family transcriptional regulator